MQHLDEALDRAIAAYARRFGSRPSDDRLGMSGSLFDGTVMFVVDKSLFVYVPDADEVRTGDEHIAVVREAASKAS